MSLKFMRMLAVVVAGLMITAEAGAQTRTTGAAASTPAGPSGAAVAPPFTSPAGVYSGISGAGRPLVGDGGGGWRSGYEGLMYDGPDPKPGWLPLGQYACTGRVVKDGLLPPIKPVWDLHLRDAVVCVGPDGTYYMTGSSGDNIWDRNDGIEI